jgi:hypothetical protein
MPSTIMPKFIKIKDNFSFQCGCTNCIENNLHFKSFDELQVHLKPFNIIWFDCPVPSCDYKLPTISAVISEHIKNNHKSISKSMGLDDNTKRKSAIFCNDCTKYSTFQHYHCYECESKQYFKSKEERDAHLKLEHTKWWLEKSCKFGSKCKGYQNGECGFNHNNNSETFVSDITEISPMICTHDKPWEQITKGAKNARCQKENCPFDHFWGHVRRNIRKSLAAKKKARVEKDDDDSFCDECNEDGDKPSKVILCDKH